VTGILGRKNHRRDHERSSKTEARGVAIVRGREKSGSLPMQGW